MTAGDLQQAAGVVEGQVLAGKYRVEKVLGVGGMGVVVAARHIQLDSKVALKFLLPSMLANSEAVSRFAGVARAAVRITSEHVARVLDVGTLENGAPYLVMEFLDGGDLAGWLQRQGALPIEQAVEFVLHACVAVADAHGIGIVHHRALRPANLFCVRRRLDGQLLVKVLDFGISKVTDASGPDSGMSMTRTSSVLGSPLYMSPEQMQTPKDVDAQTDIWALGVILYELLTAHVPFDGETIAEVAVAAATRPPPLDAHLPPRHAAGARGRRRPVPREGPAQPLPQRGRAGGRARRFRTASCPGVGRTHRGHRPGVGALRGRVRDGPDDPVASGRGNAAGAGDGGPGRHHRR